MFEDPLKGYFSGLGVSLSKSFARYTSGAMSACSFSTHEIARHVSKATGYNFNTSEKGLNYLLSNDNFQVDDHYWRQHINIVFDLMLSQDLIELGQRIYLQVDFTTHEDYFLILVACVVIGNRSVPLYYTMRNYPKRPHQYDHKKMESAFLKGLRHVLSKKYAYVIVADRGFGNDRFALLCEQNKFDYLLRVTPNFTVKEGQKQGLLKDIVWQNGICDIWAATWKKPIRICRCSNEKGAWYLMSSLEELDWRQTGAIYQSRFKIEKCFQDLKSSGFNIEVTKIRKYSRYKRLLAMVMAAHVLLVMFGRLIAVKMPDFLKNSPALKEATLAYFQSDVKLATYLNQGKC